MNSVAIRKVSCDDKRVICEIANLHIRTFTGFFLTFLGEGFLKCLYRSYAEHKDSGVFVAEQDGKVVGFLAYSCALSGLYKYMIKKHLIIFGWYAFLGFLRKPGIFFRIIRAFLKPSESKRAEKYVELASIGVEPECKGQHIGSKLIDELKSLVDFDIYAYITCETDAIDNEVANKFYQKNGFVLSRTYLTNEGRKMNEYRFAR